MKSYTADEVDAALSKESNTTGNERTAVQPRHKKFQSVTGKLTWTHYCELLSISDPDKRSFYEKESINSGWSVRRMKPRKPIEKNARSHRRTDDMFPKLEERLLPEMTAVFLFTAIIKINNDKTLRKLILVQKSD